MINIDGALPRTGTPARLPRWGPRHPARSLAGTPAPHSAPSQARRARLISVSLIAALLVPAINGAQTESAPQSPILGAWILNKDLSDRPQDQTADGREGRDGSNGGGSGRRRGGGFGGGYGRGGYGRGGGAQPNPEDVQRRRSAMRDIMEAPDRMIITQSGTTVIMTTGDGRTTRLATDGQKIKDESTKIERKTKWDGTKLVSEISGAGPGKITETYAVDPERKQLRVTIQVDNSRRPMTLNRIYDAEAR